MSGLRENSHNPLIINTLRAYSHFTTTLRDTVSLDTT